VRLHAAPQTTALSSERDGETLAPPVAFALHPGRPNPFRSELTLAFDLPKESVVRLAVFDLQGREVARLVDGTRPAGHHSVTWSRGGSIPPGVYLCRMEAGAFRAQRKIVALP
jgi:hypothetical protein